MVINMKFRCESCEEEYEDENFVKICDGEYEYTYNGDCITICLGCYEIETHNPIAKVTIHYKGEEINMTLHEHFYSVSEDDISEEAYDEAMTLVHELAEELHKAMKWHSVDPWRGYYDIDREALKNWKIVHSDCILAGSEDAEMLEKFDEKLKKILDARGFTYARVILFSSNPFSAGYSLLVRSDKENVELTALYAAAAILKTVYRDDKRFLITALTGKTRVEEFDDKDELIVDAYLRIKSGEDPEKVVQDIIKKLRRPKCIG